MNSKPVNKTSKQYLRTDAAITQAFLRLMKRKTFEQITIQDILDETPVSKGTFYAHFEDKYALAEKLLEKYREIDRKVREEMSREKNANHDRIAYEAFREYGDLVYVLLQIQTDRVNLLQGIREDYYREYMASERTDNSDLKATVYAEIMTTFQRYFLEQSFAGNGHSAIAGSPVTNSTQQLNEAIIDVFLHIIKNEDNEKLRSMILRSLVGY